MRSFRVPDELWDEAKELARRRHETLSQILREALQGYVRQQRGQAPGSRPIRLDGPERRRIPPRV